MAKGINKVLLLGNVGKDPEIRATAGGMTIASFTLATADRQKDAQGNWADKTEWHNLVAFQKYRTEILVNELTLLGSKQGGESSGGYSKSSSTSYNQSAPVSAPDYGDTGITDDDIPF